MDGYDACYLHFASSFTFPYATRNMCRCVRTARSRRGRGRGSLVVGVVEAVVEADVVAGRLTLLPTVRFVPT